MNRYTAFILLVVTVLFCSCDHSSLSNKEYSTYTEFCKKLNGSWIHESGTMFENWDFEGDTATALVMRIVDADTSIVETIQLVETRKGIFYRVRVRNQNDGKAVDFKLKGISEQELIFENPGHDFPQRIGYAIKDPGRLTATTSGFIEGERKEIVFRYSRQLQPKVH